MNDKAVIELYWKRDEAAIEQTQSRYGTYLSKIADNILHNRQDSEECVNDTYLRAWDTIPPRNPVMETNKPDGLRMYLSRITRGLSIDRWRRGNAQKRQGTEYSLSLEELGECVSVPGNPVEEEAEMHRLTHAIECYLNGRKKEERVMFLCRYFYADSIGDIAGYLGCSPSKVKSALYRMRAGLGECLKKEGFDV